ncbi:hypothetical protein IKF32_00950 [Candidatus Saccharibacteria bacterium]|nr:hypothetical protein [Candidatus Saccharibacteria bacterium]
MAKKHKKNKKWLYPMLILVLFVIAAIVVFLVWDSYFRDKKESEPKIDETDQVMIDSNINDETIDDEEIVDKPKTEQYDGDDPNEMDELTGAITFAGAADDKLMIRANIDQYLESGTCELALFKDNVTIYNSVANIVGNVSTSTCEGFDVSVGELQGSGQMIIKIKLDSGERTGTIWGEVGI